MNAGQSVIQNVFVKPVWNTHRILNSEITTTLEVASILSSFFSVYDDSSVFGLILFNLHLPVLSEFPRHEIKEFHSILTYIVFW